MSRRVIEEQLKDRQRKGTIRTLNKPRASVQVWDFSSRLLSRPCAPIFPCSPFVPSCRLARPPRPLGCLPSSRSLRSLTSTPDPSKP